MKKVYDVRLQEVENEEVEEVDVVVNGETWHLSVTSGEW